MIHFLLGWHNYHHIFPYDYKTSEHGKYWCNFTTGFLEFMAWIGKYIVQINKFKKILINYAIAKNFLLTVYNISKRASQKSPSLKRKGENKNIEEPKRK